MEELIEENRKNNKNKNRQELLKIKDRQVCFAKR